MKIKINPKYEEMRSFIERIPDVFEKEGRVIYTGRNLIKVMEAPDGTLINVKRYHVPSGPNRLIYSLKLRKPKGERAFEYPLILEKKGIGTPTVIALIEQRNVLGFLGYSYLITLQCDYAHTLYEEGFHFMIVDINRMKFGEIGVKEGLYNLRKFWGPKEFIRILVSEYAMVRNFDVDEAVAYVMKERAKFWSRFGKKHTIKFKLEL